jgi:acyl-CoA synthetase (AMP-forming)/AMP-acid ligase II
MQALSYSSGSSSQPLIGETIGDAFDRIAALNPEREAVVSCAQGARLTYAELRAATDAFARGLIGLGVKHGDRVGIWSTNNIEWVIAQFATPKLGVILVNINPAYRTNEVEVRAGAKSELSLAVDSGPGVQGISDFAEMVDRRCAAALAASSSERSFFTTAA